MSPQTYTFFYTDARIGNIWEDGGWWKKEKEKEHKNQSNKMHAKFTSKYIFNNNLMEMWDERRRLKWTSWKKNIFFCVERDHDCINIWISDSSSKRIKVDDVEHVKLVSSFLHLYTSWDLSCLLDMNISDDAQSTYLKCYTAMCSKRFIVQISSSQIPRIYI